MIRLPPHPRPIRPWRRTIRFALAAALFLFLSCQPAAVYEDGGQETDYGENNGAFRGRWWHYYQRGLYHTRNQRFAPAEADFRSAIAMRGADTRRARTYGMNFIPYFPHRELGVALFHQQKNEAAIRELELSLDTEASAKAQHYLDKARAIWIPQTRQDKSAPILQLDTPQSGHQTSAYRVTIRGRAEDDMYIRAIRINHENVPLDVSKPTVLFQHDYRLRQGLNRIEVQVWDITGKTVRSTLSVYCDRTGPMLSLSAPQVSETGDNCMVISGFAEDPAGIHTIAANGVVFARPLVTATDFLHTLCLENSDQTITIAATDMVGNTTTAHSVRPQPDEISRVKEAYPLLAAVALFPASGQRPLLSLRSTTLPPATVGSSAAGHRGGAVRENTNAPLISGRNFALLIGIDAYAHWSGLKTAANDARALKEILVNDFGFLEGHVRLLLDKGATKAAVFRSLIEMTAQLEPTDNLLIYFAGHGIMDRLANDGYWIPADGETGKTVWTWISHSAIKNLITSEEILGKNILLIADACYGGKLYRGGGQGPAPMPDGSQARLMDLSAKKSRQIITSGSDEPVADWGRDNHSLFAYYFLKSLRETQRPVICVTELIQSRVRAPVFDISGQRPVVGRFNTPLDEYGEFVLCRRSRNNGTMRKPPPETTPESLNSLLPDTTPPVIHIKHWADRQTIFRDQIYIEGHVEDDTKVRSLRINGRDMLNRPGRRIYFSHLPKLETGDNVLMFQAVDEAGNSTEKQLHFQRALPGIYAEASRMSAMKLPFDCTGGCEGINPDPILFNGLDVSGRFHMKHWEENRSRQRGDAAGENEEIHKLASGIGADFALAGQFNVMPNTIEITCRLFETQTREVIAVADVYGERTDRDAVMKLCHGLVAKLIRKLPIVEGKIIKAERSEIIVNLNKRHGIRRGMHLVLFEPGEEIQDPDTGEILGADPKEVGTARITRVKSKMANALVLESTLADPLKAGMRVITK